MIFGLSEASVKHIAAALRFFSIAAILFSLAGLAVAQTGSTGSIATSPGIEVGAIKGVSDPTSALNMDSPEQEDLFRVFQQTPMQPPQQLAKKIGIGEEFIRRYKDAKLRPAVFSLLTILYIQAGQTDKGYSAGETAILLDPSDVRTMAVLSQSMARLYNPGQPDAAQKLAKAEKYGKEAVEVTPTLKKPDKVTQKEFETSQQEVLAMAHSGLGLVYVRKANYAEAIPELEQAVKLDSKNDPTNLYLLGVANQNAKHFQDAAAAFTKCAAAPGNLQETCKSAAETAKKQASQQPAPAK
jgi:tetratricopeptide (TPR) repeat protein